MQSWVKFCPVILEKINKGLQQCWFMLGKLNSGELFSIKVW